MIYFTRGAWSGAIKIGFHGGPFPSRRVRQLQPYCSEPLELLGIMEGSTFDEPALHERFATSRIHHRS
jgi:hypothetical protein